MNRTLQILSAVLPLTDALAHSEMGDAAAATFDGPASKSPKKGEALSDELGSEGDPSSEGGGDGSGSPLSRGPNSPQSGSLEEAGEGARATPSGGGSYSPQVDGDVEPMMTHVPPANAEDSAPPSTFSSAGGGGGGAIPVSPSGGGFIQVVPEGNADMAGQSVTESSSGALPESLGPLDGRSPESLGPLDGGSPESLGPLEIDPAADDAMMILLGGISVGMGGDAQSSGEVELEIVDYGPITIGFGQVTYSAFGSEGAAADTFADVVGADLVYMFEINYGLGESQAVSTTYVLAIDFEYGLPGLVGSDGQGLSQYLVMTGIGEGSTGLAFWGPEDDVNIDGNAALLTLAGITDGSTALAIQADTTSVENTGSIVTADVDAGDATLSVNASALGPDSLINVDGNIYVDDQFSSVGGLVIGVA